MEYINIDRREISFEDSTWLELFHDSFKQRVLVSVALNFGVLLSES
jgi:hypothetical protein